MRQTVMTDIPVRLTGALLALGVSAVHVADQGGVSKFAAPPDWIGWGYRSIEVGGILTALALLVPWSALLSRFPGVSGSRLVPWSNGLGWVAGVLLGLGPALGYLASRSIGVPGDPGDVGNLLSAKRGSLSGSAGAPNVWSNVPRFAAMSPG